MKLKKKYKILLIIIITLISIFLLGIGIYNFSLSKVSNNNEVKEIKIEKGTSSIQIAKILKENKLVRNDKIFFLYIKLNKINNLNYGTYLLSEDMGVRKIAKLLQEPSTFNPDEVTLTIKEGVNMRDIAKVISSVTNNTYESVIEKSNDTEYINSLKNKYWFITDSLDNKNLYYKLEGYLYPDTYKLKNKDVTIEYIFEKMLDEMNNKLTPYKDNKGNVNGFTVHEYLSLASMIEKESSTVSDRKDVSSVFINRLNINMNLGSDVTTRYANKVDNPKQVLTKKQYNMKSPYNTRLTDGSMNGKLPVGPICTLSLSSIDAAFNPSNTDYIYFIANINTEETFFYDNYTDFLKKKNELQEVNGGF